jgi:hypothetical protein
LGKATSASPSQPPKPRHTSTPARIIDKYSLPANEFVLSIWIGKYNNYTENTKIRRNECLKKKATLRFHGVALFSLNILSSCPSTKQNKTKHLLALMFAKVLNVVVYQ